MGLKETWFKSSIKGASTLEDTSVHRQSTMSCSCFSGIKRTSSLEAPGTPTGTPTRQGSKGFQGLIESMMSWHSDALEESGLTEVDRQNSKGFSTSSLALLRRNSKDAIRTM